MEGNTKPLCSPQAAAFVCDLKFLPPHSLANTVQVSLPLQTHLNGLSSELETGRRAESQPSAAPARGECQNYSVFEQTFHSDTNKKEKAEMEIFIYTDQIQI